MRKILKFAGFCFLLYILFWCGTLIADRITLNDNLIRLHVVANSDSEEDQALKLQVRDAVVEKLQNVMQNIPSAQEAKAYLEAHLPELEEFVNAVICELGFSDTAKVSVCREAFDTRDYDTFSLPAGSYEALRITIGAGQGKNWWCVVFPSLCMPATSDGFEDVAVGSGFSQELTDTLREEDRYEVRFFFLECLGRIENFFRSL